MTRWINSGFALAGIIAGIITVAFAVGCDDSKDGATSQPKNLKTMKPGDAEPAPKADDAGAKDEQANDDADKSDAKDQGAGKGANGGDSDQASVAQDAAWPEPANRRKMFMDFNMTDQDGKAYNLKQALGKPTVATFIFTRCPNPQMCPLQAQKMAWLQGKLTDAGLADKVNLLLISFDPDYDTPQRLNKFAKDAGMKFAANVKALRPAIAEFSEFIDEFPIRVGYSKTAQVNHKTDLFLLDHNGGFTRLYYGMWDDKKVLEETQRLIDEAQAAAKNDKDASSDTDTDVARKNGEQQN